MSSPSDPLEASVRAKVLAALKKSLPEDLSTLVEGKLAQSFATGTSYKSAYRTLTDLLKPKKSDVLKADTDLAAPVAGKKSKSPPDADFENVIEDLKSKKMSIGKLLNRIQETESNKKKLLNEADATASSAAPLAAQQLQDEYGKAEKARIVGSITQRIKASKDKVATTHLEDPSAWVEIGDASLQLYNKAAPNTAFLAQAVKAYSRAESLSQEYLNNNPGFYLKRAAINLIMEDFAEALKDYETFAAKKPVSAPAVAGGPAPAAPPASYAPLIAGRISSIQAYVQTVAKFVANKFNLRETELKQYMREMPNPSRSQLQRELVPLNLLQEGLNSGKGIVGRVLGKVDQTSIYKLHSNTGSNGEPLPLFNIAYESLESSFRTPKSYVVMDNDGKCSLLSIYNVMGDEKKQKPIKQGDIVIALDPFIKEVEIAEGEKQGKFRSIQVQNPNMFFVNFNLYAEDDVVPVYE